MVLEILASLGLLFVLQYGYILNIIRRTLMKVEFFRELFHCSMCLGFWCGFFVSVISLFATTEITVYGIIHCILFGFAISFLGLVSDLLVQIGDEVKSYLWNKNE